MDIPERDWKHLRSVHQAALARYCAKILQECSAIINDAGSPPHDRYLRLYRLVQDRDEAVAGGFNDMRRSTAIQRLAAMLLLGVVTDEELHGFTAETRDAAMALRDIWLPRGRRRPTE